ncbi:MAG TPA: DUF3426 domain-containing protein [Ramlibacter sp.]
MSLITRCPACGTLFKVVPDQLRISEGWVRCGHCAEVFDASAHLQGDAAAAGSDADPHAPRPANAPTAPAPPGAATVESEAFSSSFNTEIGEGVAFDDPDSTQIEAEALALREHPLDQPFELRRRDESEDEPSRPSGAEWAPDADTDSEDDREGDAGLHEVSFVRKAGRNERWSGPRVRAALALAVLALAMLLALQIAVHDRDRLAAAAPALRPWLASLCGPLNCRVGPPRHIDAIAIDSSSFNKLRGDAYRLNVTLRNQAGVEVAMPALELTLTDGQDQALVRRVLMPSELGPGASVIAAASEWSGSLALAVAANGAGARIAGYRLLAFYP